MAEFLHDSVSASDDGLASGRESLNKKDTGGLKSVNPVWDNAPNQHAPPYRIKFFNSATAASSC